MEKAIEFSSLIGKTILSLENNENEIIICCSDGTQYKQYHEQDCCEAVGVEDLCGDIDDILGSPIILAEESSSHVIGKKSYDSTTWTFYKIDTVKGGVTIRWSGSSNGYYSEEVSFVQIK